MVNVEIGELLQENIQNSSKIVFENDSGLTKRDDAGSTSRLQGAIHVFDSNVQYDVDDLVMFEDIIFINKIVNTIGQPFNILQWSDSITSGTRIRVFNNTGSTLNPLDVVFGDGGHDASIDGTTVSKSQADTLPNSNVLGVVAEIILNGQSGFVVKEGIILGVDTDDFSAGQVVFLSPSQPGEITFVRPTAIPVRIGHVLTADPSGSFLVHIGLLDISINLTAFNSNTVAFSTADTAQSIPFNNNGIISGISHDDTTDNDEFTFDNPGIYTIGITSQVTRSAGSGTETLSLYLQLDTGGGFVNIPFSTRKVGIDTANLNSVIVMEVKISVSIGDKLRVTGQVTDTDMSLPFIPVSGTNPDQIPETSSISINITRR